MAHKCVAIVQSSYIPWKGYFDLIRAADEFILLDDVQFTKRDWRSRNRINTKFVLSWLTIPVHTKGRYQLRILDTTISDPAWSEQGHEPVRGQPGARGGELVPASHEARQLRGQVAPPFRRGLAHRAKPSPAVGPPPCELREAGYCAAPASTLSEGSS